MHNPRSFRPFADLGYNLIRMFNATKEASMSGLLDKISGSRGKLEKLVGTIPGYKGYKEKEMRREADRLLRETLAGKYEEQWARLTGVQKRLMSAGGIEFTDDVESAATKLRGFIDKLKTAAMGYGGIFSAVRVDEAALDKLYAFDNALADGITQISGTIDAMDAAIAARQGMPEAISRFDDQCRYLVTTFEQRKHVLTGKAQE
jgi:hypothetical protein